jgi:hypothetical protein
LEVVYLIASASAEHGEVSGQTGRGGDPMGFEHDCVRENREENREGIVNPLVKRVKRRREEGENVTSKRG